MIDKISRIFSGEFFLKRRPNGGGVVFARSIYVTLLFYSVALALKSATDSGAILSFSFPELTHDINETIPWAGAIFAGVYAAFYTRYASQWSYLASTYNQLMAAKSSITQDQADSNQSLINWQAGFVSDAYTLHLDRKPIFKGGSDNLLNDEKVKAVILSNFDGEDLEEFSRRHIPDNSLKPTPPTGAA